MKTPKQATSNLAGPKPPDLSFKWGHFFMSCLLAVGAVAGLYPVWKDWGTHLPQPLQPLQATPAPHPCDAIWEAYSGMPSVIVFSGVQTLPDGKKLINNANQFTNVNGRFVMIPMPNL